MGKKDYVKLVGTEKWLKDGDTPYEIGGRDTDFSQVALSLENRVKAVFPINSVPADVVAAIESLNDSCVAAEHYLDELFDIMYTHRKVS